jgi:ketosteroid isomerase-like protein
MNPDSIERLIADVRRAFHAMDPEAADRPVESGNVRRLLEIYEAVGRSDFAGVVERMTDDIVMTIAGPPGHPFNGCWVGKAEVLAALGHNFAMVDEQEVRILSVVAQGDTVIVIARERGRYRPSGEPYEGEWAQVFGFRDGKLEAMREIFSVTNPPGVR